MASIWEVVSVTLLGLFAMGQIEALGNASKNIGVYGMSTGSTVELFFFLTVAAVVFIMIRNYFS